MKNWLITGGSSGIGAGIARAALQNGDRVAVTSRNLKKLAELKQQFGENCYPIELDLSDNDSINRMFDQLDKWGSTDVLVNNAGHGYRAAVEEGEWGQINAIYSTNLFAPIKIIQHVLPSMRKKHQGIIINISSIAAIESGIGSGYYASTKAALEQISIALQAEVDNLGIKSMIVAPGRFRTSFYGKNLCGTKKIIDDYANTAWLTHKENVKNKHDELGDPIKAGQIICQLVTNDLDLPNYLLLGSDAAQFAKEKLKERLNQINMWQKTSDQTDFTN